MSTDLVAEIDYRQLSPAVASAMAQVEAENKLFELAQRKAQIYSKSTLVPKEYQGNIGNVLIAENMAKRMNADTLMVMQNLYVVHGKPGWSATFLIACFNSCGRFSAIKYRFSGEPNTDAWGCTAYTTELGTGEKIEGTTITIAMAKKEGWFSKSGSKWQSMPEQMLRYRSATFMVRSTAPEIGMGLMTKEEIEDIGPQQMLVDAQHLNGTKTEALMGKLLGHTDEPAEQPEATDEQQASGPSEG